MPFPITVRVVVRPTRVEFEMTHVEKLPASTVTDGAQRPSGNFHSLTDIGRARVNNRIETSWAVESRRTTVVLAPVAIIGSLSQSLIRQIAPALRGSLSAIVRSHPVDGTPHMADDDTEESRSANTLGLSSTVRSLHRYYRKPTVATLDPYAARHLTTSSSRTR